MHRPPPPGSCVAKRCATGARHLGWTIALLSAVGALSGCRPRQESPLASGSTTPHAAAVTIAESSDPADASPISNPPIIPGSAPATAPTPAEIAPAKNPVPNRDPDQLHRITFKDLEINMREDMVFDPSQLTDRVKELDGRRVRVKGFISPGIFQQTGIDRFPLVMNTECKFGPGGQADHVIIVDLLDGLTTSFTVRPIAVEGRLTLQPWTGPDGNTWALYHLAGEKVE